MPSRKHHRNNGFVAGSLIEVLADIIEQNSRIQSGKQEKYSLGQTFLRGFIGGVAGRAGGQFPDILEPASHPNHRQFFHSTTFMVATNTLTVAVSKNEKIDRFVKSAVRGFSAGYSLHLIEDSQTPKGIKFI